jgi:hypothetical protein
MNGDIFFVPAGRLGFKNSPQISPNVISPWRLHSGDQTFTVQVREFLRLGRYDDSIWWDKDDRSARVEPPSIPGFEARRFRDLRYGSGPDYASETIVLRDDAWMGEVEVSTGDHGGLTKAPGGQIKRWHPLMEEILGSIAVRPRREIAEAFDDLRVNLDTGGLNPRMVGEQLILSLYTPKSAIEAWGANHSVIRIPNLTHQDIGNMSGAPDFLAELSEAAKNPFYEGILASRSGYGLLGKERKIAGDTFATSIDAYGKSRHAQLTAFYNGRDRRLMLDALHQVFHSLELKSFSLRTR